MCTFKKIAANRRNAEKCTGPKTPEGKAVSSMNALKAGIDLAPELMKHESQEDFKRLTADYYEQFPPANAIERALLDQLIKNEWLTRRYAALEPSLSAALEFRAHREDLGNHFLHSPDAFVKLDRIRNSAQRNYHRAMKELLALRKARGAGMPVQESKKDQPQPQPPTALTPELVSFETLPDAPAAHPQPNPEIPAPMETPLTKAA